MNIMDLNSFLDEMDNDNEVVNMILSELVDAIEHQIPDMKNLIDEEKYDILTREAHSIKGGARNVMAEGLEIASTELENAAKIHDIDSILKALGSLINEFQRFKEYLTCNLKLSF